MANCEMIPAYTPCGKCGLPEGYPKGKCFKIDYGGDCWIAISMENDNTADPTNYYGNDDPSLPWIVLRWCALNKIAGFNCAGEMIDKFTDKIVTCAEFLDLLKLNMPLLINQGLMWNKDTETLNAWLDTTKGLQFGGTEDRQIQINAGRGITFAEDGKLEANIGEGLEFGEDGKINVSGGASLEDKGIIDYERVYTFSDADNKETDIKFCPSFISDFSGTHGVINQNGTGAGAPGQGGGDEFLAWSGHQNDGAPITNGGDKFTVTEDGWLKMNFEYAGYTSLEATTGNGRKEDGDIRMWGQRLALNGGDDIIAMHDHLLVIPSFASWPWGIRGTIESRWIQVKAGDEIWPRISYGHSKLLANDPNWTILSFEYKKCMGNG